MTDNRSEDQPATKGDLAAVKTELKSDIKRLDQKFEQLDQKVGKLDQKVGQLNKTVLSLGVAVSKTDSRMDRLENNVMTALRTFKSEILCAIDAFAGEAKDYRIKDAERGHMLMAHEDTLKTHETRITRLESGQGG